MQVQITPEALAFLDARRLGGDRSLTVAAQFVTSCCGPSLPPVVAVGRPADPDGFHLVAADGVEVYVDGLLEPSPERLVVEVSHYEKYSELTARVS